LQFLGLGIMRLPGERHGDPGRELAMLIARRYGSMSLREIGEAVGGLQYPAVSDAVRRTSARLKTDRALGKRFKGLRKILKLDCAEKAPLTRNAARQEARPTNDVPQERQR
jgi:hypothetical protein